MAWIQIVNEYWDVFVKELPRLSPTREIDFIIKLYPKLAPISIFPYHIQPMNKYELRK